MGPRNRQQASSGSRAAARAAGITARKPRVALHALVYARHNALANDQAVVFINGDRQDLRQCNLTTVPRAKLQGHVGTGREVGVILEEASKAMKDPGPGIL